MRFLSLFSGIGGLDLGLERAGWKCERQVEIDSYCQKVLARHWPDVPKGQDIREESFENLEADAIVGGFPCQDASNAGDGAGTDGPRTGLYRELLRAVRVVRPRVALLENVAGLLSRGVGAVLGDLAESGYDAEWDCVPASAVGAPHIRDRLFMVAHPNDEGQPRRALNGKEWDWMQAGDKREAWMLQEPDMAGVDDGIPDRMDRVEGLGNAVVVPVAEAIGRSINAD